MADIARQKTTTFRNWCLQVVCSLWLNFVSEVVVLLNCIILFIYDTYEAEVFFSVFFILEMLIKMMALGIYGTDRSYLRSNWHKLDLFINFGKMFDHILASFGTHLKIFITLSPMRLISGDADLRRCVTGILKSQYVFWHILTLCMFGIHIFVVVGVHLFHVCM